MIFRGPFPQVTIPEIPVTAFVLQRAKERGDKPALIDGPSGRIIKYSELADQISRVAASLWKRGFKQGEVFGILSPNLPEYAIAFHAVASLGGITSPVNPLYTEHEIAHQLKDAGARFLAKRYCNGDVKLSLPNITNATFNWANAAGTTIGTSNEVRFFSLAAGIYYVTVTIANSCTYLHTIMVGAAACPPVFANAGPNQTGIGTVFIKTETEAAVPASL